MSVVRHSLPQSIDGFNANWYSTPEANDRKRKNSLIQLGLPDITTTLEKAGYRVGGRIGKGTTCEVYKGLNVNTNQEVAFKIFEKESMDDRMYYRINKEVEIHQQLNNPALLRWFDWLQDDNYLFLVLELCEGTLQKYVKDTKGLPIDVCQRLFKEIVSGVHYLHQNNFCHRDLKLTNILLTKEKKAKIADYGLAQQNYDLDALRFMPKTMCGTPNFIAPEIIKNLKNQDYDGQKADAWSLGCILYTMHTGRSPFESSTYEGTFAKVKEARYTVPPNMPSDIQDLIQNLLQNDPHKRPDTLKILTSRFLNGDYAKPPIFTAYRLRNVEKKLKDGSRTLKIVANSHVSVEFLKNNDPFGSIQISVNGFKIFVAKLKKREWKTEEYTYENLPEKYYKNYRYVAKFVALLKSRTPKITCITKLAKGILMEDRHYFIVQFFDTSQFDITWDEDHQARIKITDNNIVIYNGQSISALPPSLANFQEKYQHVLECMENAKQLEKELTRVGNELKYPISLFPVTFSRRQDENTLQAKFRSLPQSTLDGSAFNHHSNHSAYSSSHALSYGNWSTMPTLPLFNAPECLCHDKHH